MFNFTIRRILPITVIAVAVILLAWGGSHYFSSKNVKSEDQNNINEIREAIRDPLTGQVMTEENFDFFPIAVMMDNASDIPPQAGLSAAAIIYEALAESNITRLLAIFNSQVKLEKVGPIRSARNYFMDWAEEYHGLFMHVGGSPQALAIIDDYKFTNIDEMGAAGIYFFRDDNLAAPHNVFTNSSNILRAGEMKKVSNLNQDFTSWHYVDDLSINNPVDLAVNFSIDQYNIVWKFNHTLNIYQRFRNNDKSIDAAGEHLAADNIIVQIVPSSLIDVERRSMDTQSGGVVFIFNKAGEAKGHWEYRDGRTLFFDDNNQELSLVPGKTWVEIIDDPGKLIISE